MAEMLLEMQNRDTQLSLMQEQNQKLQKLNSELSELLNILPNTEELAHHRTAGNPPPRLLFCNLR